MRFRGATPQHLQSHPASLSNQKYDANGNEIHTDN